MGKSVGLPPREVKAMAGLRASASGEVDVFELTPAEYESALAKTLERAGVTYQGLEAQARTGTFTSPSLAGLWALIRHTVPVPDGRRCA